MSEISLGTIQEFVASSGPSLQEAAAHWAARKVREQGLPSALMVPYMELYEQKAYGEALDEAYHARATEALLRRWADLYGEKHWGFDSCGDIEVGLQVPSPHMRCIVYLEGHGRLRAAYICPKCGRTLGERGLYEKRHLAELLEAKPCCDCRTPKARWLRLRGAMLRWWQGR